MSCASVTSKSLMYFFNTVIFLSGAAIVSYGVYIMTSDFSGFFNSWLLYSVWAFGIGLTLLAIVGFCGTESSSKKILIPFSFFLIILLLSSAGAAIGVTLYRSNVTEGESVSGFVYDKFSTAFRAILDELGKGFGKVWTAHHCQGGDLRGSTFSSISCSSPKVESQISDWCAKFKATSPDIDEFDKCVSKCKESLANGEDATYISAWCRSRLALTNSASEYSELLMYVLWGITVFLLAVTVCNFYLACVRRRQIVTSKTKPLKQPQIVKV